MDAAIYVKEEFMTNLWALDSFSLQNKNAKLLQRPKDPLTAFSSAVMQCLVYRKSLLDMMTTILPRILNGGT